RGRVRGAWRGGRVVVRDRLWAERERCWRLIVEPAWSQIRLVLEADATYRARRLASGGFNELFADLHPNLRFADGTLTIREMLGRWDVDPPGPGLLLVPPVFTVKPVPPMRAPEPPALPL